MGAALVILTMMIIAYGWAGAAMVRADFDLWEIKRPTYARRRGPHVLRIIAAWPKRSPLVRGALSFLARAGAILMAFLGLGLFIEPHWMRLLLLAIAPIALAAPFVIPR
ncbi:hypothetical protein GC169_06695 [bacterium]|nr:hypothetical protein [bacterium]